MTRRVDPLGPDAVAFLKDGGEFLGELQRKVGVEIHGVGNGPSVTLRSGQRL